MLIQPSTVSRGGTASDSRSATIAPAPQGRWGSLDVSGESGVVPSLSNNTRHGTRANDNNKIKDTQQNSSLQHRKPASTIPGAGQLPNATTVPGALPRLAAADLAASADPGSDPPILVADAETLGKIGRDRNYPPNGNYQLTVPCIDGGQLRSIGNDTHPFTGSLHGEKGTIDNLRNCLMKTMAGEGLVYDLRFTGANITSTGPTAVVACQIKGNARVSNIRVENAHVSTCGDRAYGGVVAGLVEGKVDNAMAVNCTVQTSGEFAHAGIGAGKVDSGGTVANTTAVNCQVNTSDSYAFAAIGAGAVSNGTVTNTRALDCTVETSGDIKSDAGIGAGHGVESRVTDTTAVNSTVTTSGQGSIAGIGAGWFDGGTVTGTTAVNCHVTTNGTTASAGIGGGQVGEFKKDTAVTNTVAEHCHVKTVKARANAAIGAGRVIGGTVTGTKAVNCTISTEGKYGTAGIGAGAVEDSRVANTTALNCELKTTGNRGSAGLGAGKVVRGNVTDTTAVHCKVETFGYGHDYGANGGIGAGIIEQAGIVDRTTAFNCTIKTKKKWGQAGIGAGAAYSGTVANSTAVHCRVETQGYLADAAIGTGFVTDDVTVANTLAVNSNVTTTGLEADAGFGAGEEGTVTDTTAVNSTIKISGDHAQTHIDSTRVCNTYANDFLLPDSPGVCPLDNVCEPLAHPLLLADCQPDSEYLDRLGMPGNFNSDFYSIETLTTPDLHCPAPLTTAMAAPTATATAGKTTGAFTETTLPVANPASPVTLTTGMARSTGIAISGPSASETLGTAMALSTTRPTPVKKTLAEVSGSTTAFSGPPSGPTGIAQPTVTMPPLRKTVPASTITSTRLPTSTSEPLTTADALTTPTVAPLASSLSAWAILGITLGPSLVLAGFVVACIYRYYHRPFTYRPGGSHASHTERTSLVQLLSEPLADAYEMADIAAGNHLGQESSFFNQEQAQEDVEDVEGVNARERPLS